MRRAPLYFGSIVTHAGPIIGPALGMPDVPPGTQAGTGSWASTISVIRGYFDSADRAIRAYDKNTANRVLDQVLPMIRKLPAAQAAEQMSIYFGLRERAANLVGATSPVDQSSTGAWPTAAGVSAAAGSRDTAEAVGVAGANQAADLEARKRKANRRGLVILVGLGALAAGLSIVRVRRGGRGSR